MSRNNLKAQLQQLQDRQKIALKEDNTMRSEIVKSNQKESFIKGQQIQLKNKENILSQIQLQASTKESSQLYQKKNSQNEQTIHSDIFNTSNISKTQGMLALKFSNTYTQPLQARGEIQSTVSDVHTLESVETLNTNRSHNNYNQKIVIGEDNKIHSQQVSNQNDRNLLLQNRRYSANNSNSFQHHKQANENKTSNKKHNNYASKIESSEERILNACQLNFDDRLSSQQNDEQDPSIYNYNDQNSVNTKMAQRNKSQDITYHSTIRNSPFYSNQSNKINEIQQKLNFQKKVQNLNPQINLQEVEHTENIEIKKLNNQLNQKTPHNNQTCNLQNSDVYNSNYFNIGENEGERQILKCTKEVYIKDNSVQQSSKNEQINTLNLINTEADDKKFQDNIFTTNSDMPSIILNKTLKSETSNIFERGFTLNDQPSSKNQMSFINEVEDENTQRSKSTHYKIQNNGNSDLNTQYSSSQRILTLNPNQEIHENQISQNTYSHHPQNYQNEEFKTQNFFYQNSNNQYNFQNNIYNTPTLKGGRLTENTNNSLDLQENKQEPVINQFAITTNTHQNKDQLIQKDTKNVQYPSMFDRGSKFYHESEASVCNEMQEIYKTNNDKPQLKAINIPNKVNALLSSHATEENNSFLNSHRNNIKLDSDGFSGMKNEVAFGETYEEGRQQVKKQQEQIKQQTHNHKQEQFLQQFESKRPHFLSQEIQIPIVSDNCKVNGNNDIFQGYENTFELQNTFQNNCFDDDQFTKNLNTLINNNDEQTEQLKNLETYLIANQPQMKRDSEEQIQRVQGQNQRDSFAQNTEQNNQVFAEYNQEKIKKMNEEIRQKLKQINLQTTLNSTIQISQTPTTQRELEEKSQNFMNQDPIQFNDQSQRSRNMSAANLNYSINQPHGQTLPYSQQLNQTSSNILPGSIQKSKQSSTILPISQQINQSQTPLEQRKMQSFQNLENQEKSFNTTCSNILQYQDINPNLNKSQTRPQEEQNSQSSFLVDHKHKQQQIQSTHSTSSSGLNKRSISNSRSRYDKQNFQENVNRITQNPSPNNFAQLNQSILPENRSENKFQEIQKSQKSNKLNPPQLDPNISDGDDLQINPLDVISPQEKLGNCISFQNGRLEDPHLYPSFQQPSSYYNNYPLFVNHDTETDMQNNKATENQDNVQGEQSSFIKLKDEYQHKQNNQFLNQKNQSKNQIKNTQQNVTNKLAEIQENLYKNNKINISNLNYTNDNIQPPSCSSKNSLASNHNSNHYNAFSYKQFIMNMKKNVDTSLTKETTKKQKQNDSFIKKVQTAKKPVSTTNVHTEKAAQNKDFDKLNKLIDQQIQKNVIRPLIKRQNGDKDIGSAQNNVRSKASFSHHTPSTPQSNINSIPNTQRPVQIEIPSNLDISLHQYLTNQLSQKNSFIQSNKSQNKISSKSALTTPTQNKYPNNNFQQTGNQNQRNTNQKTGNGSFIVTPSTSKNNLDRNHSFCLPKERSLSNNKKDNTIIKRNTCSKSPISKIDYSSSQANQNLMMNEDTKFNNDNILSDLGIQQGFYTTKNQNCLKRDHSIGFIKHSSKK